MRRVTLNLKQTLYQCSHHAEHLKRLSLKLQMDAYLLLNGLDLTVSATYNSDDSVSILLATSKNITNTKCMSAVYCKHHQGGRAQVHKFIVRNISREHLTFSYNLHELYCIT